MSRHKLDHTQSQERLDRREARRTERAGQVELAREWIRTRAELAQKRSQKIRDSRTKGRALAAKHALPEPQVTVEPYLLSKRKTVLTYGEVGVSVIDGQEVVGNHDERRARGARGHQRKTRLRELPGADAQRIKRQARMQDAFNSYSRKAWTA